MSFKSTSIANLSDSDDELYEAELVRKCTEVEALLWQQKEKKHLEYQAQKETKIAEWKQLEEEAWRKQEKEEAQWREEECQRDLAYYLEANHIATMEQQQCKNWTKTFLSPTTPSSNEEINLIDLLSLTKRQRIRYLSQETPEVSQRREKLAREIGISSVGGESLCERCMDFGILCIPQNLP